MEPDSGNVGVELEVSLSLEPTVLAVLRIVQVVIAAMEAQLPLLLGHRTKASALLCHLILNIVILDGDGAARRPSDYLRMLGHIASAAQIRKQLKTLLRAGAIEIRRDSRDRRALRIHPTHKLILFFHTVGSQ